VIRTAPGGPFRDPTETTARPFPFLLTRRRRTQGYRESLGLAADDASLTLLWIPPGRFWMGSPAEEPERTNAEGPQHLVQLQGFFLGQTPVTQAQWQAVASWPKQQRNLNPHPSHFHGPNKPVEQVSWPEAMEFCHRLRHRTGRHYTLPSEAQWEYACRAGTTTPFHFGATLSTKLANYDGNYTYADGQRGEYREQTTEVSRFPANAWGLQDMHSNVWEWCLDNWRGSYGKEPLDGSAWLDSEAAEIIREENMLRLLRGGSWNDHPRSCRSAYRLRYLSGYRGRDVGFRLCCLPQD
jgi:formylglycine-generating enzyme required for sulfatase activity